MKNTVKKLNISSFKCDTVANKRMFKLYISGIHTKSIRFPPFINVKISRVWPYSDHIVAYNRQNLEFLQSLPEFMDRRTDKFVVSTVKKNEMTTGRVTRLGQGGFMAPRRKTNINILGFYTNKTINCIICVHFFFYYMYGEFIEKNQGSFVFLTNIVLGRLVV